MKRLKIINHIITLCIVLLLVVIGYYSISLIKMQKNEEASDLIDIDRALDNSINYEKIELKPGLNLIAIDLAGPVESNRADGAYGDAAILEQNKNYLLIDTGSDDNINNTVIEFLKSQNINRLSIYVSHYHIDHYAKLKKIIRDDYFTIDNIYLPDPEILKSKYENKEWYDLVRKYYTFSVDYANSLKNGGFNVTHIGSGSKIKVGEATLEVLWDASDADEYPDSHYKKVKDETFKDGFINFTSLVSMITYKGKKILTCGDLTGNGEKAVLKANIDIKADIFKFSHHGGSGHNSDDFMNRINPTYSYYPDNTSSIKDVIWIGEKNGGKYKDLVNNLTSKTNVFSTLYNGNLVYNISPDGEITASASRNYHTLTIKYLDEETNKDIAEETKYMFNDKAPYHLGKLLHTKDVNGYSLSSSNYTLDDTLTEDKTIINYYKKIPTEIKQEQEPDVPNTKKEEKSPETKKEEVPAVSDNKKEELQTIPDVKKEESSSISYNNEKKNDNNNSNNTNNNQSNNANNNQSNNTNNNQSNNANNNQSNNTNNNQSIVQQNNIEEVIEDEDFNDEGEIADLELDEVKPNDRAKTNSKQSSKAIAIIIVSTVVLVALITLKLRLRKMIKSSL